MGDANRDRDIVEAAEAAFIGSVIFMGVPENTFPGYPRQCEETYDLMINCYPAVTVRPGEI